MAMRITTKMMQNTSLNNLNTNKTLQEKLTTQMSTMKKITRPSDDPVIAIRSLKLNSSLDKIDQYYEKNTEDAESWLTLTESAIDTTEKILTSMRQYIVQASQGHLDTDDRAAILQNLTNFKNEIYSTGNADSAGRMLFTGYRTDTPLTFKEDNEDTYTITEQRTNLILDTTTYISKINEMAGINEGNFASNDKKDLTEYDVESKTIPRIRLAYSDLDENSNVKLSYIGSDGNEKFLNVTSKFATGTDAAYESVIGDNNKNAITYIASTGELLLGSDIQKELSELPLDAEIRITYDKTDWKSGDLNPIHYFYTERKDNNGNVIKYNPEKLSDDVKDQTAADQVIEYDIGSNQTIRVNTTADEVFTHDIGRDVDEVVSMLNSYSSLLETRDKIKALKDSGKYEGDDLELLTKQYEALDKECTLTKDRVQKNCEGMLTSFDGYIKNTALAQTDVGARESRLQLIQNRLSSQQTNFEELVSENEDADITQLAIDLSSVQLTYQAALSSISYVMKTTLLDFI